MSIKYQVSLSHAAARYAPISKFNVVETDGCLGCLECVKRTACIYDVYKTRTFDPRQVVDSVDSRCTMCLRCVQECKKNILSRVHNPQFRRIGDETFTPDIVRSIWQQAESGRIPVSGAGYTGPFVGPGFDSMWTDMSEIIRPTRDGIHGREYISTVIELGRRPDHLEFDDHGELLTRIPSLIEVPIPILFEIPAVRFVRGPTRRAIADAARQLQTFVLADEADLWAEENGHFFIKLDDPPSNPALLSGVAVAQLMDREAIAESIDQLHFQHPGLVIAVQVPLSETTPERAVELAQMGVGVIHLRADRHGKGTEDNGSFATTLVRAVHERLQEESLREQVTLLYSGGIALAEHVAKIILCGVDGVVLDLALLAALECRLCRDCDTRDRCPVAIDRVPVGWGTQRIVNLIGSWHGQLIEILGAMGLREVRRLRGELGRAMFFEDLERASFAPLFGVRHPTAELDHPPPRGDTHQPEKTPSRFKNRIAPYKVVRLSEQCAACGKCAEVCQFQVHSLAGKRMGAPKSYRCVGPEQCRSAHAFCGDHCDNDALRVGPDPLWQTLGDERWTAALQAATWHRAETGIGRSEAEERGTLTGGFDRIRFVENERGEPASEEIDISLNLNKRNDGRPQVTTGMPIYGGGMSYGSISATTMIARARAYRTFSSFTCTGEGGYPEQLKDYDDNVITQVATGLFGVSEETIQRVRIVEFKYAQGAKPGLGGHLLGDKVTAAVADIREAVAGTALFSPFPFHSVYSVEDHKKHVDWIKAVNPRALVSVKVSTPSDVDMVAVGSYYAGAHIVHVDGSYGGTGAAPDIAKKNIAMPIEYAVPQIHRFLVQEGIRDEITLIASGGLRTIWDIAKVIALGADGVAIGTAELIALECTRCGSCESGRGCPRGIATTDPALAPLLEIEWATERLINLFHSYARDLRQLLARFGLRSIRELCGRTDLLRHLDYQEVQGE